MKLAPRILNALPADFPKEDFERRAIANSDLLNHFALVLTKVLDAHKAEALSTEKYNVANWAYLQADSIGYQRALAEAIKLITIKD